ncbi:Diguanylate cyclase with hemerythrin-like metal-binding domain-containing protein (fragment) [Candidatus Terasakiella magnetica]
MVAEGMHTKHTSSESGPFGAGWGHRLVNASLKSIEDFRIVINSIPIGVTLLNSDLEMVACNIKFKELLDFPDQLFLNGLPNMAALALFNAQRGEYGPGDPNELANQVVVRARSMQDHRYQRLRPGGVILEIEGHPIQGGGFISIYTDITERYRAEELLRQREGQLRLIYDTSSVAIFFVDQRGFITHANRRMSEMFACPMQTLIGSEYVAHIAAAEREVGRRKMLDLLSSAIPSVDLERHYWRDDGTTFWGRLTGQRMHDESGRSMGLVGVILDITDRRAAEQQLAERSRELEAMNKALASSNAELMQAREALERMAMHDQLTGLANRHKFLQTYSIEVERRNRTGGALSLLLVDVDHFKVINDRYGHLAGDICLRAIASVLERSVRAADLVGRFGGEEFVVLLPETDAEGALAAAENLCHEVRHTQFEVGGQMLTITISVGTATLLAGQSGDFDRLVHRADLAVYRAKGAGRDAVVMGLGDGEVTSLPGHG